MATMAGQVNLCFWVAALSGIVHGFPSKGSLSLDETFYDTKETMTTRTRGELDGIINVAEVAPTLETELNNTKDEMKILKPVHEMYPHAVLYGKTCGGTIISPTWVLTAAHCTVSSAGKTVLAGTNNTEDGNVARVKRKVIHPLFTVGPFWLNHRQYLGFRQIRVHFDYLLVELEEPLPLNGVTMKAAILNETYKLIPGMNVSFAGYGADNRLGKMDTTMHMRKFELKTEEECARIYGYNNEDMICAKGSSPDFDLACYGDSGSGLVDENGVLIGVASWVEDDAVECRRGAMVYFAKIAAVREWIREVTNV